MASQIVLKHTTADDCIELTVLKSKFNRLATQINRLWIDLSPVDRNKLYSTLKEVEEQISKYT